MCTVIAFFLYPYMKKQDHKIWEEAIGFYSYCKAIAGCLMASLLRKDVRNFHDYV